MTKRKYYETPALGTRFGKLVVISTEEGYDAKNRTRLILCRCDCGREEYKRLYTLMTGRTTKCKECILEQQQRDIGTKRKKRADPEQTSIKSALKFLQGKTTDLSS